MPNPPRKEDALHYHRHPRPGKVEMRSTKACLTSQDLSLAYSPGVAYPCLEIAKDVDLVYEYTNRPNLVAVISNGTAVLGLGNIGPEAGKPVMEGKGVLFKRFADIDVFDIELNVSDPDKFIEVVEAMAPTFGGINLEDIKAPECFYIETQLKERLDIPVMHDDQHGTAIIATAAFLNALQIANKKPEDVKIVTVGAGAAGIACLNMMLDVGVQKKNIFLCDSRGVIHTERPNLSKEKARFAQETDLRTLADAMVGADMFLGLSVGGLVSPEMVLSMAENPIVFALANPTPEIDYPTAKATRSDIIMATGRSDYPNQVNNVLGFPFIFRGALDVRASKINNEMKIAASKALAELARQQITDQVRAAYGDTDFTFGPDYIIPKPFDKRVLYTVAPAVALAAMETGVAQCPIQDIESYKEELKARFYPSSAVMSQVFDKIRSHAPRIVFPEATSSRILLAVEQIAQTNIARPILIGNPEEIYHNASEIDINLHGIEVIDPSNNINHAKMVEELVKRRSRKGMTKEKASRLLNSNDDYFGAMMVETGACDGMVSGLTRTYPEVIRPVIECIGTDEDESAALCAVYMIFKGKDPYFFADTAVHVKPNADQLARIAMTVADFVRQLDIEPRVAMLSFSSFGSARSKESSEVAKAVAKVKQMQPDLIIDGEMQVEVALQPNLREKLYDFSSLTGPANVLIFPNLDSGNISYKLMRDIGGAEAIGPVLLGLNKPVHVLQRESDISTIINLTAITALRSL